LNEKNSAEALNLFSGSEDYVVTDELKNAVNIAIALEKPLLIKGEPGTGKTVLAKAIANTLGKKLIIWNIKSTTKAQDGLYVYDTVQRLYDSQFGEGDVSDIKQYIKFGQLGQALSADEQAVLLIDEIDKADLEFPNDLLWELDQMEFFIPETRERITAKTRPIVIITSNAEKELPNAFLRRCIFHYIAFPEPGQMTEIVRVHYPNIEDELLNHAMDKFYEIRSVKDMQKRPSTSELLDWLMALMLTGIPLEKIDKETPYLGVLLKKNEDIDALALAKEKNASRSNLRR
jgi:MoxR-like ATPase